MIELFFFFSFFFLHTVDFNISNSNINNNPNKRLNSSIWPIDKKLTGTTTQSVDLSNGNEGVLHIPQTQ